MMPNRTHAKIFARALVGGMMLVLVVVLSGCEAQRGDPDTASWDQYIKAMDDALARGDFYAADLARQTAYLMALGSQRWEAMVAMGDAYARFADAQGASPTLRSEARRVYRSALFRARRQGSVEGVLRVSEALAARGDREGAREGLAMATAMAAVSRVSYDVARAEALAERLDNEAGRPEESAADVVAPAAAAAVMWTR